MKIETKLQHEQRLKDNAKHKIKDLINERMNIHIEQLKQKNRTRNGTNTFTNKFKHINENKYYINTDNITNINDTDYEAMWETAIDQWTRNWNFYTERLTDSILNKFNLNTKRQKRQTNIDFIELTGQNINGSATGPQDIFIEHYDCDAEEITNVKYYELNKISTCKFKPLDLDMTKTEVQLLSKAQAVEIKAYAVAGTIKERVEWCSQHTNYIRANRPSYYVSDAQRTKILDADEVRNELARINLLKNTQYKPTRYNISFNFIANPPLQKKIEDLQGRIQFDMNIPLVPPYGRIVYDYTNPLWIPSAIKNAQSNCMKGPRKQNRIDILDWTLEIREVSLILNLDPEEISYMGTKLPCDLRKGECLPTPLTKATIVWEPQTHCQLFELIRFDAYMVKYQDRYWIETNAEWTTVQQPDITKKIKLNQTDTIATRFEVYPLVERECGSPQPLHKTEYDDIYIIYEYGFDMHTGQKVTKKKDKFDDEKFIKIKPEQIISERTRYEDKENQQYYYGFVNEETHLNMKMDLYMSNIYSRLSLQAIEFYSQICEQTRNLRQLTLTQVQKNTPLLGYILTGDRSIFVKQEGVNVMKMYKCAKKSSPLYVPQTRECYDKIPILYKNRVQYVHQLTRQTYLWAKTVPCSHSNFDQLISIDTEGTARYRVTPYPVKVETILNTISPEEIVLDNMFSKASLIESGIYSKEQLIQERKRDLLHEYMRDREKPLQEATSANAQKLLELEQLGLLQTYKNYEQSLKWLKDLNINGYNFQIDQPSVNWKEIFDGEWLKDQILSIFGWPWYILEKMAIIYAMISMILFITNLVIKFYNAFAIHKAIGKQASITKILLTGIFGIFSQTLTQLVAQIQEDDTSHDSQDSDNNYSHYTKHNKHNKNRKHTFRRHSSDVTHLTRNENNPPEQTYIDTNYKHYNTTIRRTDQGLELRTLESPPKKQKPPLPERKYKQPEPLKIEPLETITENKMTTLPPQLITPPPAYQCLGNNIPVSTTHNSPPHVSPTPSAPNIQQTSTFHGTSYETQLGINKTTPYEIPQPSHIKTQNNLIPSVKLIEIQNPPPIDFTQLKLAANKMNNRSHSLDILNDDDQPHTNEVTYFDTHSATTYEV